MKNFLISYKTVFFLLFFLVATITFAAPIKVTVDRDSVSLNESFQITFSATEDPDANPDFSPLEKEFEIITKHHGSSSSWDNGVSSMTIQWTFDVMAKHAGAITIPPLHFGSETSPALTISVTEGNKPNDTVSHDAELFLEVEATPKKPYIQAQVLYTLRFFRRVNIAEASLKDPEIADAVVTKLAEDKNYKTQLKDQEYAVTERKYAIFPQKSGSLIIPSLTLTAAILEDESSSMGGFFGTRSTRNERVSSKPITLTVLTAPETFKGHWVAAEQLEVKQQWSGDVQTMKVGEPLTRTLTLIAKGTTVGQLPKLQQILGNEDLKTYPDQPRLEEQKNPQGIVAIREEKIAFIPAKAGTYVLPAVKIPWFNVKTQHIETSIIPAVTIIAYSTDTVTQPNKARPLEKFIDKKKVINNSPKSNSHDSLVNSYFWQGLATFFALGWLITVVFFFRIWKKTTHLNIIPPLKNSFNDINADLKKACANHDAMTTKQILISWGKRKYNVTTLGTLAEFCDARLRDEILILNQHLYSRQSKSWDGKKLFQTFTEHCAMKKAKSKLDDKLEPLHRI